jgi:hypothetical protein
MLARPISFKIPTFFPYSIDRAEIWTDTVVTDSNLTKPAINIVLVRGDLPCSSPSSISTPAQSADAALNASDSELSPASSSSSPASATESAPASSEAQQLPELLQSLSIQPADSQQPSSSSTS